jgi:beta-RFAP synthase
MPSQSAEALSQVTGRGVRSAVGSHGFALGGLIVDQGKQSGDRLGALAQRVAVHESWRVVLITARQGKGLAGQSEQAAFAQLPEIDLQATARLQQIGLKQLVPAVASGDFEQFSEAVYAYGHQAGLCFASLLGRAYSTEAASELIRQLRQLGIAGVGQSSWGPTLFAFTPDAQSAKHLTAWLQGNLSEAEYAISIAAPRNSGAILCRV